MVLDPARSEEQRLISEYRIAIDRYSAAIGDLALQRETMKREDYIKLLAIEDEAHNECERVRNALAELHG